MRLFSVLIYGVTTWCVISSRFVNGSIYLSSIKLEHIMADIENFLRGDCFQKRLLRGQIFTYQKVRFEAFRLTHLLQWVACFAF